MPFKELFSFRGTLDRSRYVIGTVIPTLLLLVAIVLITTLEYHSELVAFCQIVMFVCISVTLWILSATTAKRLHDLGLSGWFQAPVWVLNIVALLLGNLWASTSAWALTGLYFIILAFTSEVS